MMKKYIASLLIGLFAFPIMPAHAGLSESDRAQITIRQKLVNPGFEMSTAGWAASTAAHLSIITSGVGSGNASAQWAPTGAGETLSSGYVTISSGDGLSNTPGVASCRIKTVSGNGLPTIEAFDGTNKLTSFTIVQNTSGYTRTSANFIFPASGTARLQFTSVASPATIALDDCYFGIADGFNSSQINQVTPWQNYTPTITGAGTVTVEFSQWRKNGDNVDLRGTAVAGTPTASALTVSLPTSATASDSNSTSHQLAFTGSFESGYSGATQAGIFPIYSSASVIAFGKNNSQDGFTAVVANNVLSAGARFSWTASVPTSNFSAQTAYYPDNGGLATGDLVETFATACPTGTIAADGSAISRTAYAALFAAISTTYGAGDGSTTFNVPNGQGVFIRGAGSQTISSIAYSGTQGTTQGDQTQGHNHTSISIDTASGASGAALHSVATASSDGGAVSFTGTIGGPTSDGTNGTPRTGSETRPANIVAKRCVRTLPASPAPLLVSPEIVSATHNAFSSGGGSTASTWYIPESTWGVTLTPGMWDIQMDGNADTAISGTYGVQVIAGLSDGTSHLAYSMCGMAISGPTPSTQEVGCHVHVTYTATSTVTVKPELRFLGFTGSGSVTLNWRNNLDTQPTGSLVARRVK